MSVPYERYDNDEIEVEDHERSGSESDPEDGHDGHEHRLRRAHVLFSNRWPKQNGLMQLGTGFLLTLFGLAEVLIIPLATDTSGQFTQMVKLYKGNCYGIGIWAGIVLTLTGSLALRASVYRSICTVYTFFTVILLDVLVFTAAVIFVLIAYSRHWTTRGALQNDYLFGVHVALCLTMCFGLVLIVHSFTQYYEDVFCGELQLAKRLIHCCCPCWCPPPVAQHELLQDPSGSERPPSLPV